MLEVSSQVSESHVFVLEVPSKVSERSCICVRGTKPGK